MAIQNTNNSHNYPCLQLSPPTGSHVCTIFFQKTLQLIVSQMCSCSLEGSLEGFIVFIIIEWICSVHCKDHLICENKSLRVFLV